VYQETGDIWISQITFSFEHPDSMLEKLYSLPSSLLSQICHLRIHLAYLDIDATPEAQKPLNNHYSYEVIEYELPSVFQLLSDLRLETLTLLGWEFESMESLDNIIPFFQDNSHWKELRFITPWTGSNEVFEVSSHISDRSLKSESALSRFESLISRWTEHLQERGREVNMYHSSVVGPQKRLVYDQLSGIRVSLHGRTDPQSQQGHEIDKFMLVIKRDDKDQLLQYDPHSIRHLVEDRLWDQLRVPPRHVWPEEHAGEEEIDTYRYLDGITWAPKDFDAPMRDEWDMN
jgi:hypothetical protein